MVFPPHLHPFFRVSFFFSFFFSFFPFLEFRDDLRISQFRLTSFFNSYPYSYHAEWEALLSATKWEPVPRTLLQLGGLLGVVDARGKD